MNHFGGGSLQVLLPLIAFFLYAFQPKNKFECGPDACAPLTYINSTIPPQCTIDPPSYFPVLSVCSYVGPEQNVSHGALSFPQCQPSPVGAKMAFSSNETVRSTQTDFVIPAIACAYECTEQTCPGWYHINDRSAWAVWLIMGAISALVTVIKVLTLRSSMEPYKVWEVGDHCPLLRRWTILLLATAALFLSSVALCGPGRSAIIVSS